MPISVLEAIREGQWDFEPVELNEGQFKSTRAMPGSDEKVDLLAARALEGLPLWHPEDRMSFDDSEEALE